MNKIIIITLVIFLVGAGGVYYVNNFSKPAYDLTTAQRGDLVQEVFASGKIETPTSIDLHFKTSGKMIALKTRVGKVVSAGQLLAKQDTNILDAQMTMMQANIDIQKAKLDQLKAGASREDIQVTETTVVNAQQAVSDARQNLVDKLYDAYTKADDAIRGRVDELFLNPLSNSPHFVISSNDSSLQNDIELSRILIENNDFRVWKSYRAQLTTASDLSEYLNATRQYLNDIGAFLDKIALSINNPNAVYAVNGTSTAIPSAWKTGISTARTNINTTLSDLSAAEGKLKTAEASLKIAQDQLTLKKAPLRSTDIAVYEAQIRQAEAQMQQVRAQIQEAEIIAPVAGTVTATNGGVGEIIDSGETVVSVISGDALQIKANLSENNVAGVKAGQPVRITVDALPDEWQGKVVEVDPAGTVINGSVYYKTTVTFNEQNDKVKVGMTTDIWIKTGEKANTLMVPISAIKKGNQSVFVEVYKNGQIIERAVTTGLKSQGGMVEIIDGLSEGEQVIVDHIQ